MNREEAIEYLTILGGIGGITDNEAVALEIAIEALEQEPRWIPDSERLPKENGNYLVTYCYQGKIETQEAVYVEDEECKWFDTTDIEITLAVIAWMPLPEPYREVKE